MLDIFRTVFKYREKRSPDKLGAYPEQVHVSAMPERRYLWSSRLLVIFSCISICLSMILASSIYLLLPQRSSYPRLMQANNYFSHLELTDLSEKHVPARELLTEQYIEEYIMLRHVISNDIDEILSRWSRGSKLYWMSSEKVYTLFTKDDAMEDLAKFRSQSLTRLVEIEWIRPISVGLWSAQFVTMDYYPNQKAPTVNIWRAYLRVAFTNINYANYRQRALNPYGFLVLNYSLSYLGTPEEPESYLNTAKDIRGQKNIY
ncbi:MAG: hypothetical protein IKL33_00740 [Alphaproteobacteria bacterium]|nr:hypothetical protein [Alphaproteobacteria bacterium]